MSTQAVLFMVGFLSILFAYIYFIGWMSRRLGGRVPAQTYSRIEMAIILGILFGTVAMFQPWTQTLYRLGFFVVLFSTLSFIVWSHVSPQGMYSDEVDLGPVSLEEIERRQADEPA